MILLRVYEFIISFTRFYDFIVILFRVYAFVIILLRRYDFATMIYEFIYLLSFVEFMNLLLFDQDFISFFYLIY